MKDENSYIWRTMKDRKVRSNHSSREGQKFSWSEPPTGGHPGQEYGCRCWAEAVHTATGLTQELITKVNDRKPSWETEDFFYHGIVNPGQYVSLEQMGLLNKVIKEADKQIFYRPGGLRKQLIDKIREVKNGSFDEDTINSYEFEHIVYAMGDGVVATQTYGTLRREGNITHCDATITYKYTDVFEDTGNIRSGLNKNHPKIKEIREFLSPLIINENDNYKEWFINFTNGYITPFPYSGTWQTKLYGSIELAEE